MPDISLDWPRHSSPHSSLLSPAFSGERTEEVERTDTGEGVKGRTHTPTVGGGGGGAWPRGSSPHYSSLPSLARSGEETRREEK